VYTHIWIVIYQVSSHGLHSEKINSLLLLLHTILNGIWCTPIWFLSRVKECDHHSSQSYCSSNIVPCADSCQSAWQHLQDAQARLKPRPPSRMSSPLPQIALSTGQCIIQHVAREVYTCIWRFLVKHPAPGVAENNEETSIHCAACQALSRLVLTLRQRLRY
jgi:hypothetical protein